MGFARLYRTMFLISLLFYGFQPCGVVSSYTRPVGLDEPYVEGDVTKEDMLSMVVFVSV